MGCKAANCPHSRVMRQAWGATALVFTRHKPTPGRPTKWPSATLHHIALSSFASYADYAQAYQARAKPMAAVTPEIAKLARDLTLGAADERDKVRRLYNWVSRNIRYVAVYAGAGGWVPHSAASVLENLYGDCKDHVTLLEALLDAVGIASSPALINSSDANRADRKFNRMRTSMVQDFGIPAQGFGIPSLTLGLLGC